MVATDVGKIDMSGKKEFAMVDRQELEELLCKAAKRGPLTEEEIAKQREGWAKAEMEMAKVERAETRLTLQRNDVAVSNRNRLEQIARNNDALLAEWKKGVEESITLLEKITKLVDYRQEGLRRIAEKLEEEKRCAEAERNTRFRLGRFSIFPFFAWYDFWVGVFVNMGEKAVYVFPFPTLGVKVVWGEKWK